MKSGGGDEADRSSPDYAALHPGYVQSMIVMAAGKTTAEVI
ncbi:MAG TPA: hypothetical protein VMR17_03115 [Xanthobacteraceae bacterium]|nr:hypothetical protein [Xanthobacteraceae bacterium]